MSSTHAFYRDSKYGSGVLLQALVKVRGQGLSPLIWFRPLIYAVTCSTQGPTLQSLDPPLPITTLTTEYSYTKSIGLPYHQLHRQSVV